MKKTLLLLTALSLLFTLAACGNEPIGPSAAQPSACDHSWKDATCTDPKTCEKCGMTEGEANGHRWQDATCTDGRMCAVCSAADPESEPLGHLYTEGKCTRCGEIDPDYPQPTISVDKTQLNLSGEEDVIHITLTGAQATVYVIYDIGDTNIVDCSWGLWDENTVTLTFIPISSGETSVTVSLEGYDNQSITIHVTVDMPQSQN